MYTLGDVLVAQASPFCPNIAATPDGRQVWLTLKDTGKTEVFAARPPFKVLATLYTGPITHHVNIVRNPKGQFAYVTVGGLNEVKVFRTRDFAHVATIPVGDLPHGIWSSGDGTRIYAGLENADKLVTIDTMTNRVIAESPLGQGPQALTYVPDAIPDSRAVNLQPPGLAGMTVHLAMAPPGQHEGAAIVNAVGPIRQIVQDEAGSSRRYLVISSSAEGARPLQVQIVNESGPVERPKGGMRSVDQGAHQRSLITKGPNGRIAYEPCSITRVQQEFHHAVCECQAGLAH